MQGKLEKMTIEGYIIPIMIGPPIGTYSVMFNPTSYQRKYNVVYFNAQALGDTKSPKIFNNVQPRTFSFEFFFDGTGTSAPKTSVTEEVDAFMAVCGQVNENISRPMFLKLSWGDLLLKVILQSADVTYTLFQPDGTPLRAKVNCVFAEYQNELLKEVLKKFGTEKAFSVIKNDSVSNFLTDVCQQKYGDPTVYMQVAAANGLPSVRGLAKGIDLNLPPLKP